jgi:hypothetical protein
MLHIGSARGTWEEWWNRNQGEGDLGIEELGLEHVPRCASTLEDGVFRVLAIVNRDGVSRCCW